jgi:Mrp family chromosome partitioning ATPase
VITAESSGAQSLRASLRSLLEPAVAVPGSAAHAREPDEPLGEPPFDTAFRDRCRVAVSSLLGVEDEGVIEVSSPRRKEGRTSVAAAVALVLASARARSGVLLLDLDFERPGQADVFSMAPSPGLADYLEGRERLRGVAGGPEGQLCVIPAGNRLGDPMWLLHMLVVDGMLSVFRESFQWVVVDLPPLLGSPEVTAVAARADWHIMVGRHRRTSMWDLRKARDLLGTERESVGFVMTGDSSRVPGWIKRRL